MKKGKEFDRALLIGHLKTRAGNKFKVATRRIKKMKAMEPKKWPPIPEHLTKITGE